MYVSLPTDTDWPSTMASVSGSVMMKREPCPTVERTSMLPPSSLMFRRTTSMPTPRPEMSVAWSAVEKPAMKMRS